MKVKVDVDGQTVSVEGEDVLAWHDDAPKPAAGDGEVARSWAAAYVRANPRPIPDAQGGVNIPARQRMALLRRLAAGPATKVELLEAMRSAAGYVGGDDWRNRYDELRGHGKRGGGHLPLPIEHDVDADTYRLVESFATLSESQRRWLAHAKAALDERLGAATTVLDGLLPDVGLTDDAETVLDYTSSDAAATLDAAMQRAGIIELRYVDGRTDRPGALLCIPGDYVTTPHGLAVRVIEVDLAGRRTGGRVIPLRGVREVILHPEVAPAPEALEARTTPLVLQTSTAGAAQLRDSLHGLGISLDRQDDDGTVVLRGDLDVDVARDAVDVLLLSAEPVRVVHPRWLAIGISLSALRSWVAQADASPNLAPAAEAARQAVTVLEAQLGTANGDAPSDWLV